MSVVEILAGIVMAVGLPPHSFGVGDSAQVRPDQGWIWGKGAAELWRWIADNSVKGRHDTQNGKLRTQ